MEYIKIGKGMIEQRETKLVTTKYNIKMLKEQKAKLREQLDKVNLLLEEARKLGEE